MRNSWLSIALAVSALCGSVPTQAQSDYFKGWACNFFDAKCNPPSDWERWEKAEAPAAEPEVQPAPEIDGAHTGLALALVGSLIAISRERQQQRKRRSYRS